MSKRAEGFPILGVQDSVPEFSEKMRSRNGGRQGSYLTVGETPGFAERGGMIRLMLEDNRVRFEVNVDAAHDGNLNISSRLLTLARIISPTGPLARKPG